MTGNVPEYKDVPYQVITTSRKTVEEKRPLLLAAERAMMRAMLLCRAHPDQAKRIVREVFKEVDDADFNIAFDTYVKAVPATPVGRPGAPVLPLGHQPELGQRREQAICDGPMHPDLVGELLHCESGRGSRHHLQRGQSPGQGLRASPRTRHSLDRPPCESEALYITHINVRY